MTEREKLIEVMARTIALVECVHPEDLEGWMKDTDSREQAEAALTALEASGVRLVPGDATGEMVEAAYAAPDPTLGELVGRQLRTVRMEKAYTAMLAASPYAPEAEG